VIEQGNIRFFIPPDRIEPEALQQVRNTASMPFVHGLAVMLLEPTGALRDTTAPVTLVLDTLTAVAEMEMKKAIADTNKEVDDFVEIRGRRRKTSVEKRQEAQRG